MSEEKPALKSSSQSMFKRSSTFHTKRESVKRGEGKRRSSGGATAAEERRAMLRKRGVSIVESPKKISPKSDNNEFSSGGMGAARKSMSSDKRAKRATAVTFFMRNLMGGMDGGDDMSQNLKDAEGVKKPVVVEFLEKAITAVLRKSTKHELSLSDCQELIKKHEEKAKRKDNSDSDNDSNGSEHSEERDEQFDVLNSMQENLMQGANVATLAGLLYTSTFSIKDKRIDQIIGANVPIKIREVLILELCKAIDGLWERFGMLLVEQYKSFEAAFKYLDDDESGFIDREEFTRAFVDIHLQAIGDKSDAQPDDDSQSLTRAASSGSSAAVRSPSSTHGPAATAGGEGKVIDAQAVSKMNKMILKADAEFLFDMLRTGERGLVQKENDSDAELEVPMRSLVMRLAGLGEKTMETLREHIIDRYSTLENAFAHFVRGDKLEMNCEEFEEMYRSTFAREVITEDSSVKYVVAETKDGATKAKRIFNGINIDGDEAVTITELHRALANFAPPTNFTTLRRRILLQYGSHDSFFASATGGGWKTDEDIIEAFTFEQDLNTNDGRAYAAKLGLVSGGEEAAFGRANTVPIKEDSLIIRAEVPADGYSIEEFGVSIFLNKEEEAKVEDIIKKLGYSDRDKDIPFREFSERIVDCGESARRRSWMGREASTGAGAMMTKSKSEPVSKAKSAAATSNQLAVDSKKSAAASLRKSVASVPISLPVSCKFEECRMVYEALQREHRRVSINILHRALTNFSDVVALDRTTYQSGDRIISRVRLSNEWQKKCKELPIIAIVPERLEWKEQGSKSHWVMDGEKVVDLLTICERVHELPRSSNGSVLKEACVKISVPYVDATMERYEVRIFSSSNGREPGKQIGRAVPFDLLMPRPQQPLVDQVCLHAATGEASVVLHWSPPSGRFTASPILNYVLQVEPLIYRHELVAEAVEADVGEEGENVASEAQSAESEEDDELDNPGLQDVTVWSPTGKGFITKLSYRVDGLQRGVQYRFGVQCVHAGPTSADGRMEVRGAPSELCDIATMPLYNVTEAPGAPAVTLRPDGMISLVWTAPADEGVSDTNRICGYLVQYRNCTSSKDADAESNESEDFDGADDEVDSDEEEGWVAVDETLVFISQPKYADFYGWQVPCYIADLPPIDDEFSTRPHEFRVCSVNYAGNSPWSRSSAPIALYTPKEEAVPPPPVTGLSIVDVIGHKEPGMKEAHMRSQLILSWDLPAFADKNDAPKYTVCVRDATQIRGEGGWVHMDAFVKHTRCETENARGGRRRSSGHTQILCMVTGLERFPYFANLAVQVQSTTSQGTSVADILLEGMDMQTLSPPPEAPMVVQALHSEVGPRLVELQWPAAITQDKSDTQWRYVVQAAYAAKPSRAGGDTSDVSQFKWSDFKTVDDVHFAQSLDDDIISCFARGSPLQEDGFFIFRIGVVRKGERLELFSPVSTTPFEVSKKTLARMARASVTVDKEKMEKQVQDMKPRKPRDVQVLQTEEDWCQISWEQRVGLQGEIPRNYEVEVCREDSGELEWQPVKATFVSMPTPQNVEGTWRCTVIAAVFFASRENEKFGQVLPRWRVRVRVPGDEHEWSSPTSWQLPPQPPVPAQPSVPSIVRSEQQFYMLEWNIPEGGIATEGGGSYQLQVQTHQQRRGGKVTDWANVPVYTSSVSDGGGHSVVRAVVERPAAAEVAKTSLSSGDDKVRFRVRIGCDGGVTGQPSGPSEFVPIQMPLPPVPAPPRLELIGHGRILMESKAGSMMDAEFVRLEWPLPSAEDDAEHMTETGLASITYDIEARDEDHGFWVPMPGALIELDRKASTASALLPLPPAGGHMQHTHFRVAASRGGGGEATFSEASPLVFWGSAIDLESPPKVMHAVPTAIVIHYVLPHIVARPGICSVSAALQICKRRRRRKRQSLPSVDFDALDAEAFTETEEADEAYEVDDYDDKEDGDGQMVFETAGEFPVFWRSAALGELGGLGGAAAGVPGGLSMTQSHSGCLCESVLMLDRLSMAQCVPGDQVRVAIRVCAVGVEMGELSEYSAPIVVAERVTARSADLQIEYPKWSSVLPIGTSSSFTPHLFAGAATDTDSQAFTWCREAIRAKDGSQRLHFEVSRGALPKGLELDPETGHISGIGDEDASGDSFTVRVRILVTWPGRVGATVVVGAAASTTLKCSLVEERELAALQDVLRDSVVSELLQKQEQRMLHFIAKPKILSMTKDLQLIMDGDSGDSALELLNRVLRFPNDAIVVAAELEEEELLTRLFGDSSSEEESSRSSSRASESSSSSESSRDSQIESADLMAENPVRGDFRSSIDEGSSSCEGGDDTEVPAGQPASDAATADRSIGNVDEPLDLPPQSIINKSVTAPINKSVTDPSSPRKLNSSKTAKFDCAEQDDVEKDKSKYRRRRSEAGAMLSGADFANLKSRRQSLALQANSIKLAKLAEFAQGVVQDDERQDDAKSEHHSDAESENSGSHGRALSKVSRAESRKNTNIDNLTEASSSVSSPKKEKAKSRPESPAMETEDVDHFRPDGSPEGQKERNASKKRSVRRSLDTRGSMSHYHSNDSSRAEGETSSRTGAGVDVEISYPNLTPLWSAFTDIKFTPLLKCYARLPKTSFKAEGNQSRSSPVRGEEMSLELGRLAFSITPQLPANVQLDESTGIISGSPLSEHVVGRQYMVVARLSDCNEIVGSCAVAFAVVAAEVASVCNAAYLGQEPPAFRSGSALGLATTVASVSTQVSPQHARGVSTQVSPQHARVVSTQVSPLHGAGAPEVQRSFDDVSVNDLPDYIDARESIEEPRLQLEEEVSLVPYQGSDMQESTGPLPAVASGYDARRSAAGATPRRIPPLQLEPVSRKAPPPNWKSKFGSTKSASPRSTSRTTVFPLGPPLRNREPMDTKGIHFLGQPASARPWLNELYDAHAERAERPKSQGLSSQRPVRRPSTEVKDETRASTAPSNNICRPMGATSTKANPGNSFFGVPADGLADDCAFGGSAMRSLKREFA